MIVRVQAVLYLVAVGLLVAAFWRPRVMTLGLAAAVLAYAWPALA